MDPVFTYSISHVFQFLQGNFIPLIILVVWFVCFISYYRALRKEEAEDLARERGKIVLKGEIEGVPDQRGVKILKMIVNDPSVSGKELEQTLGLSRKQISYSLGKINDYLKKNGFEEIKWLKTGRFLVSLAVIREYQSEDSKTAEYTYVLSDEERYSWLTLRLLCHTEELSTYHFTDD